MRLKKIVPFLAVVAVATAAIAIIGCSQGGAKDEVRIGVILPLSGDLQSFGKSTLDGIEFRVEEINKAGGINGKKIVLMVEDNKNDQDQTITNYKKLVGLKKVSAVIGPITSTNSLAVLDEVTDAKTPTISPTATNDKVAPGSPYMFRACYQDSFQGTIAATYARKDLKKSKAALMIDTGSDYSIGLSKSFKDTFVKLGGEVVAEESYKSKQTDYGVALAKIKDSGAEIVFVPGYPGEVPLILKQAEVMGIEAMFCGADGWDHADIITKSGDKIIGSFLVGAFSKEDTRPEVQNFMKAIKAKTGNEAGSFEALGYDSMALVEEAMKAKGMDPEQIKEGLLSLKSVKAVTGNITITSEGNATKAAVVLGVEKAEGAYVKKYIKTVNP